MTISSPYRFVPLSDLVIQPDWANQVSQDAPFEDGVCGELTLLLTNHTRLCVGGTQDKYKDHPPTPSRVNFYRTAQGKLAIPSTSLKGMLRNVLEIASFSRFKQVEDQKLGVRDISSGKNFYTEAIVRQPVKAGWMKFEDGGWNIYPCKFARLHQQDLINELRVNKIEWVKLKKAAQRYQKIGVCPTIRFNFDGENNVGQKIAEPCKSGSHEGRVVVTGQPSKDFTVPKAKKWEFIFYAQEDRRLSVSPDVMAGFSRIHVDSDEWAYWKNKLKNSSNIPHGIPVFFHQDDSEQVISLGLAMMYKLPYKHSIHDAIRHTSDQHLDITGPDLADLIFGYLGENGTNGLRGRVHIGLAELKKEQETVLSTATVLSSPKPTYYPFYMLQNDSSFQQLMKDDAELSGWKRYQVKPERILPPPERSTAKVQVQLELLPQKCQFSFKLMFHNLRPIELGALLWSMDFGQNNQARHSLGVGKPYGLGQVSLKIDHVEMRHNNPQKTINNHEFLQSCRDDFIQFIQVKMSAAGLKPSFEDSMFIKALIKYATPSTNTALFTYISNPQDFMRLRNNRNLPDFKNFFHDNEASRKALPAQKARSDVQQKKIIPDDTNHNVKKQKALTASPVDPAVLDQKIQDLIKKNTNPQYSSAFYLLEQLSKPGVFLDAEKKHVAKHIEAIMRTDGSWQENSSTDKKERKKYDKTMEVKRFLT